MRALISGYYGFGNLGDEALLEVIVRRVRERFPSLELDVLSATPVQTASRLAVSATPRWDSSAVRAAVRRSDVVISGGGGLLQNATSIRSLLYYAAILRSGVRARKKTMIFAQSVGPLDALGKLAVRYLCKGVDRATVRDARSYDLLRSLLPDTPVEHVADPVFLYDAADEEADLSQDGLGPESGPYAVASVRKIAGLKDGVATIARAIDRLADVHGIRTALVALGGAPDAEAATLVIRSCSTAPMLLPSSDLAKTAAVIRGARVAIGMRLHALILAARFAVPFLAIPYDPKVAALCEDLDYPLEPLWVPGARAPLPDAVDARVDRLVSERDGLASHLSGRMAAIRAAAERNFDVLGELIDEP
ncbi:MAG: polysaccharide pyruvyl transferase CsaB [Vulcanimicrobiaceae bacterium]